MQSIIQSPPFWVLSWLNQLLLSPSLRAMQGHHKVDSVTLYGRDDVWLPLSGQRALRRALLLGWRPTTPQHRDGQQLLQEPQVLLPSLEALGDFPPEGAALPVLCEEVASEPVFRRSLLCRISRLSMTSWGDRTQRVLVLQRSLLFLVPARGLYTCAPLLFAPLVAFGQKNFKSCTSCYLGSLV